MADLTLRGLLHLDRWRVVLSVFALGAAAILVAFVIVFVKLNRAEAARVASAQASYNACVVFVPVAAKLNEKFGGGDLFAKDLLPVLRGLGASAADLAKLRSDYKAGKGGGFPPFTKADCEAAREKALHG